MRNFRSLPFLRDPSRRWIARNGTATNPWDFIGKRNSMQIPLCRGCVRCSISSSIYVGTPAYHDASHRFIAFVFCRPSLVRAPWFSQGNVAFRASHDRRYHRGSLLRFVPREYHHRRFRDVGRRIVGAENRPRRLLVVRRRCDRTDDSRPFCRSCHPPLRRSDAAAPFGATRRAVGREVGRTHHRRFVDCCNRGPIYGAAYTFDVCLRRHDGRGSLHSFGSRDSLSHYGRRSAGRDPYGCRTDSSSLGRFRRGGDLVRVGVSRCRLCTAAPALEFPLRILGLAAVVAFGGHHLRYRP